MKCESSNWWLKTAFWLLAIATLIIIFAGCATTAALPFAGQTKHHPIKRMTQQQWRQAQLKGKPFYHHKHR